MTKPSETFRQNVQPALDALAQIEEASGLNAAVARPIPPMEKVCTPAGLNELMDIIRAVSDATPAVVDVSYEVQSAFKNRSNSLSRAVDAVVEAAEALKNFLELEFQFAEAQRIEYVTEAFIRRNAVIGAITHLRLLAPQECTAVVSFLKVDDPVEA